MVEAPLSAQNMGLCKFRLAQRQLLR